MDLQFAINERTGSLLLLNSRAIPM